VGINKREKHSNLWSFGGLAKKGESFRERRARRKTRELKNGPITAGKRGVRIGRDCFGSRAMPRKQNKTLFDLTSSKGPAKESGEAYRNLRKLAEQTAMSSQVEAGML